MKWPAWIRNRRIGRKLTATMRSVGGSLHYYTVGIYNRTDGDHAFLLAGGLAFALVICAIPLILIVFSVLGVVLDKPVIAEEINNYIDRVIPYERYAEYVRELVFERVQEFRLYKNLAGLLGLVGLLFASSGLFSSLRTILNSVYRVGDTSSVLVSKMRDFALILLALTYFLVTAGFVPLMEILFGIAGNIEILAFLRLETLADVAVRIGSFLIFVGGVVLMHYFVPDKPPPKSVILVSAIATSVLWTIAQELFGVYVRHAVTLRRVYGTYMLLIAVVFWVYYSSLVFVIGGEIGQLYRERKRPQAG
jgi:membrane protein